jgi:hypothetical protein
VKKFGELRSSRFFAFSPFRSFTLIIYVNCANFSNSRFLPRVILNRHLKFAGKISGRENMLKKFLILSMILGSMIFGISSTAEAKTSNSIGSNGEPQWQKNQKNNRRWRNNSRARVVTRTRFIYINGRRYREIWQYKYLPNGRVERRLLGRTRVR